MNLEMYNFQIKYEDWYSLTRKAVVRSRDGALFKKFRSLLEILLDVYPGIDWDPLAFRKTSKPLLKESLRKIESELEISQVKHFVLLSFLLLLIYLF